MDLKSNNSLNLKMFRTGNLGRVNLDERLNRDLGQRPSATSKLAGKKNSDSDLEQFFFF